MHGWLRLALFHALASALLVPWSAATAQTKLPAGVTAVRSVEGIAEYRLANGLQVLLYPDPSKPTATVNVTYRVGSRQEGYGETGMAHLLEHLLFKGSKRYPSPEREFSRRGFQNNGTTFFDRTNYYSTFQASDDNLSWALGWKADAMTQSFIARRDLDSEMTVVRNEFESGENEPTRVMFTRMLSLMFDWHNYGNSTIGNRSDIENVRIENLQAFYRLHYQPDNATLVVAGKFDTAKTLTLIAQTFGRIPATKRTLPPEWTVEPTQDGERSFMIRRKGDEQLVMVGYRLPSLRSLSAPAVQAAADLLGNTPNGRLHKAVVETGLATEVFAWPILLRDPGMLMIGAIVKLGDSPEKARDQLVQTIETTFARDLPSEAEMTRLRKDSETGFERALADPQSFGVMLSEYIGAGDWRLFFHMRNQLQAVTAAQIAEAAAKYLRRDNRTVGIFVPEAEPQRAQIAAALPVETVLKDFQPRAAVAQGEVFDPSQANIDRRTRRVSIGELRLALLPKKNRGGTVSVLINPRWGDEKSLFGKAVVAQLTDAMIGRGTVQLTRQQIADEMTRLKMQGGIRGFQTDRANVVDALRLAATVLRDASFPAAEFDLLKRETIASLQAGLSDPEQRSRDALRSHFDTWPAGDPRAYIPLARRIELVNAATVEDLRRFHAEFFGTARGEIAVIGDFDDQAVEALVRERFAGWASRAPYAVVLSEPREVKSTRIFIDTPDRENAFYRARINVTLRDDDPDFASLQLANYIFGGGGGLSNRLMERVRQRDGISYGAGSGLFINSRDRAGGWQVAGITAPQNTARFEQAVREELDRMLRDGLSDKEIADAKNGLLQERVLARSDDGTLAGAWSENLDLGRTFTSFSKPLEDRLRALTTAEVNAAVRRHFDPARLTIVIAGDAKKGAR
jgi:zinc protease